MHQVLKLLDTAKTMIFNIVRNGFSCWPIVAYIKYTLIPEYFQVGQNSDTLDPDTLVQSPCILKVMGMQKPGTNNAKFIKKLKIIIFSAKNSFSSEIWTP